MMRMETANIPSEDNGKTGSDALRDYLEAEAGYLSFKILKYDEIYIKNYMNNTYRIVKFSLKSP